jgi:phosphate:Na+ symporter
LIYTFPVILSWFEATWTEPARQVAMFHTLYNVAVMLLLLPLVKLVAVLMQKIVPHKPGEVDNNVYEKKLQYLDVETAQMPAMALVNAAHSELCRMGKMAHESLTLSLESFFERNEDKAKKTLKMESVINYLNHQITSKLVEINHMALSEVDSERIAKMFKILSDIERIGDHAENIAEYTFIVTERNLKFSDVAIEELRLLGNLVTQQIVRAINAYENDDKSTLSQINSYEKEVDKLSKDFTENHISRLKVGDCDPQSGVLFTDMIIDLERSADHAENIAFSTFYNT